MIYDTVSSISENSNESNDATPRDREFNVPRLQLNKQPIIAILGSTAFSNDASPSLCRYLGEALLNLGALIITTGATGIEELVAWSFIYNGGRDSIERVFHMVPSSDHRPGEIIEMTDIGRIIAAGIDEDDRMYKLINEITAVILIEGEYEAANIANYALKQGKPVIPVARTGGAADGNYGAEFFPIPSQVNPKEWTSLYNNWSDVRYTAWSIANILSSIHGIPAIDIPLSE